MLTPADRIATITNVTGSGQGSEVTTFTRPGMVGKVRFFLNVTALAGTAPTIDVTIVSVIGGVDHVVGTFAQAAAGASKQNILVDGCPDRVKAVYTAGGAVTDFDATVDGVRF